MFKARETPRNAHYLNTSLNIVDESKLSFSVTRNTSVNNTSGENEMDKKN